MVMSTCKCMLMWCQATLLSGHPRWQQFHTADIEFIYANLSKQMDGMYFWLFCKNYLQPLELARVIGAQDPQRLLNLLPSQPAR
ncbi:hypothetical protein B0I37DRAFT_49778 [Chaetomium sp. MPI-CAGE-AT-0009]|nr:hypothetical protein B0I37DRAFT_49778 [Chaetomium sp. MPI-CAGE-AT-0009]